MTFDPKEARALVDILNRPYGNLTGAEKRDAAANLTAALDEIERLRGDMALAIKAIEECRDEIDQYIRNEYPLDHPVQERYRKRYFASNPARVFLDARAAIKEKNHG